MKVNLLYQNKSFTGEEALSPEAEELFGDLDLEPVVSAMAGEDILIRNTVKQVLLSPLRDENEIRRRQKIVKDCLEHPEVIRGLYRLSGEAMESRKQEKWWIASGTPFGKLRAAADRLRTFHGYLKELRKMADQEEEVMSSDGMKSFFREIQTELDDRYLSEAEGLLEELEFRDGILSGVSLGPDNRGTDYTLLLKGNTRAHIKWKLTAGYTVPEHDDAGARDLSARKDRIAFECAGILREAADHMEEYMKNLQREAAFYVGAITLAEKMKERKLSCSMPVIAGKREMKELKNLSLALHAELCVGNDLSFPEGTVVSIITGANQGGKTTFLRSVGQAQLMMQSGLFVCAKAYEGPVSNGIFTHFRKEEEEAFHSGKLDEELRRMDQLVPHLKRGSLILFNESFASTNEREGSEICSQISEALRENGTEAFYVTHLYSFSHGLYEQNLKNTVFLCAERETGGSRSYRIIPGEPEATAYGKDLLESLA